jgi:uncharacterized protein (TIGR02391 family)
MNIETLLDQRLLSAIQSTYSDRNFTGAILDAIYFLSDLIREKTALQSDGTALAGQALGGKSPRLKVNKLETESERNIQAGVEQLLRGLYQAVRNPRSHGKHLDKQEDADAIILFINYLAHIIDQSKAPFTKSEFLKRVFDPLFVEKERYAQLLASEIPPKYRLEVILDVFRSRETGEGKKLAYFVSALLPKLTKEQKSQLYSAMSEELKLSDSDAAIRTIIEIFPNDSLSHLDESARLRTENKLIQSITQGSFTEWKGRCNAGALGTWASSCCDYFLLKTDLFNVLTHKLSSTNPEEQAYVFHFFWNALVRLFNPPPQRLVNVIKIQLKKGNKALHDKLTVMQSFGDTEWAEAFKAEIEAFKEQEPTPEQPDDNDIPF